LQAKSKLLKLRPGLVVRICHCRAIGVSYISKTERENTGLLNFASVLDDTTGGNWIDLEFMWQSIRGPRRNPCGEDQNNYRLAATKHFTNKIKQVFLK